LIREFSALVTPNTESSGYNEGLLAFRGGREEEETGALIKDGQLNDVNELALVADSRDEKITRRPRGSIRRESIESSRRVSVRGMQVHRGGGGGCDSVAFQYLRAEIFTKSHRGRRIRGYDLPDAAAGNSRAGRRGRPFG